MWHATPSSSARGRQMLLLLRKKFLLQVPAPRRTPTLMAVLWFRDMPLPWLPQPLAPPQRAQQHQPQHHNPRQATKQKQRPVLRPARRRR